MRDVFGIDEKLNFGKNSNRTYRQVAQMHPSYFCWLIREKVIRFCGTAQEEFKQIALDAKRRADSEAESRSRHFSSRSSGERTSRSAFREVDPDDPEEQWARDETQLMGSD
jgi:hypothetical protein